MVTRSTTSRTTKPSTSSVTGVGVSSVSGGEYDTDAQTYFTAVELADGEALETAVKDAINAFVVGCKSDGIWTAIKAACLLCGARTLDGALVPLVGAAPTNNNFVSGDYSRTAGLTGNASTKYINTNRNTNADPQDSQHLAIFCTTFLSATAFLAGVGTDGNAGTSIAYVGSTIFRSRNNAGLATTGNDSGFTGLSRATSAGYVSRTNGVSTNRTQNSQAPISGDISIFATGTVSSFRSGSTIAFYSIGEALDLELLDFHVSELITAIGAALA